MSNFASIGNIRNLAGHTIDLDEIIFLKIVGTIITISFSNGLTDTIYLDDAKQAKEVYQWIQVRLNQKLVNFDEREIE